MKSPENHLTRWLYFIVFIAWSVYLLLLMASREYMSFLRPEFGLFLVIAYFIASGYMITAIFRFRTTGRDMSAVFRALVLLVPIFYSLATQDTILGNQAFMQRFTGTFYPQSQYSIFSDKSENNGLFPSTKDANSSGGKSDKELTILDIYRELASFRGKHVSVKGMIMHDVELKQYFGGNETAVYRFVINCCAADALPLAIAIDSEQAGSFIKDQWVQIEGIFDLQQMDGKKYPIILKPLIKPIEAPRFPYLF